MLKQMTVSIALASAAMLGALPTWAAEATTSTMGQMAMPTDNHTAREEAEGKAVWEKLQAKKMTCVQLSQDNFATLGEYFMGQQMGSMHEEMNRMLTQMTGEKGEEQMHVTMGKRMSGCEPSAAYPAAWADSMPMMNMHMMNFGHPRFAGYGWVLMLLWWVLAIAGVVAIAQWVLRAGFRPKY